MDTRVKRLWVEALRSGKYEQGGRVLRRGNKFCCLGVLCDLHREETGGQWEDTIAGGMYLDAWMVLPKQVAKWAGLGKATTVIAGSHTLADYNDGVGVPQKTFAELADIIEAKL